MKTITIKKSYDFSPNSRVMVNIGAKRIHLKGFGSFSFTIEPGQELFATYQWTRSNRINYDQIINSYSYLIKPRLGKILAFISLVIFSICTLIFLFTKYRWSFIPLVPIALYVLAYLTILRNKYLIIKSDNLE